MADVPSPHPVDYPAKPTGPPMTAEQFIGKYRRNYCNYAALIDVAFAMHDESEAEYKRLSDVDLNAVVAYAREHAYRAM